MFINFIIFINFLSHFIWIIQDNPASYNIYNFYKNKLTIMTDIKNKKTHIVGYMGYLPSN
jgi:hypothetical protein